jgi:hypothetical protein
MPRRKLLLPAIVAGIGMAAVFQVLALLAYQRGFTTVTQLLDWPSTLVQAAFPCQTAGSAPGRCAGSPLMLVAYLAGLPLSAALYSWLAYLFLRRRIQASDLP